MIDGVPEGQVPRDAAFWRTHHAVLAEMAEAFQKLKCEREGHVIVWGVLGEEPRCECGLTAEEVYQLYEAQGRGRLEYTETGMIFRWGQP